MGDGVMKLVIGCILLIFVPGLAIAAPPLSGDQNQRAAVEMNALYDKSKLRAETGLPREIKQPDPFEHTIIGEWNERVFNSLKTYSTSPRQDLETDFGQQRTTYIDEQTSERNMVTKVLLNETLRLTRERIPEIDSLVKAIKLEISSETTGTKTENGTDDQGTTDAKAVKKTVDENEVYYKTGVRLNMEGSFLELVSETEVKYSVVTYYYKVHFYNQSDNSLGMTFVVGRDISIKLERSFSGTMDPITGDKANRNTVQLVSKF
jgi:hypothetical protein